MDGLEVSKSLESVSVASPAEAATLPLGKELEALLASVSKIGRGHPGRETFATTTPGLENKSSDEHVNDELGSLSGGSIISFPHLAPASGGAELPPPVICLPHLSPVPDGAVIPQPLPSSPHVSSASDGAALPEHTTGLSGQPPAGSPWARGQPPAGSPWALNTSKVVTPVSSWAVDGKWAATVSKLAGMKAAAVGSRKPTSLHDILQEVLVYDQPTWEERDGRKRDDLHSLLRSLLASPIHKVVCFVSNKQLCRDITYQLQQEGYQCDCVHGGKMSHVRRQILERLNIGEMKLVISTDVIPTGTRVTGLTHVVLFDMVAIEDYLARIGLIGWTAEGPFGCGHSLTFFEYDHTWPSLAGDLIGVLEQAGQQVPPRLRQIADAVVAREAALKAEKRKAASDAANANAPKPPPPPAPQTLQAVQNLQAAQALQAAAHLQAVQGLAAVAAHPGLLSTLGRQATLQAAMPPLSTLPMATLPGAGAASHVAISGASVALPNDALFASSLPAASASPQLSTAQILQLYGALQTPGVARLGPY